VAVSGSRCACDLWDIAVKRWLAILSRIVQKTKGVRFLVNYHLIPRTALGLVEWEASFAQALASELALLQTVGGHENALMRLMTGQHMTRSLSRSSSCLIYTADPGWRALQRAESLPVARRAMMARPMTTR
jgi:hypothetical protein